VKDIQVNTRHHYTGLSICGCTAHALIGDTRDHDWMVLITAEGPCHPDRPAVLAVVPSATDDDAVASITDGDWPQVAWVGAA